MTYFKAKELKNKASNQPSNNDSSQRNNNNYITFKLLNNLFLVSTYATIYKYTGKDLFLMFKFDSFILQLLQENIKEICQFKN